MTRGAAWTVFVGLVVACGTTDESAGSPEASRRLSRVTRCVVVTPFVWRGAVGCWGVTGRGHTEIPCLGSCLTPPW